MAREGHMLFAPNLTGPIHVGTALNLWLAAREAQTRGIGLAVRLDDRYELPERYDARAEADALRTLEEAFDLLCIGRPDRIFRLTAERGRYMHAARRLLMAGLAVEETPDTWVLAGTAYYDDLVWGRIRDYGSPIVFNGEPYSTLAQAVDCWDFRVPLVIDAVDLERDTLAELRVWDALSRVCGLREGTVRLDGRERPRYAHVPLIADERGEPLHKSDGVGAEFEFTRWARRFGRGEDLRRALERIVLWDDGPFAWDKVLHVERVRINAKGERVGADMPFERGIYCEEAITRASDTWTLQG